MDEELKAFFKEELKKQEEKFEHHVGVVAEQFEDQTAAVAEQYTSLDEKVTEIQGTLAEHTRILKANQETLLEHDRQLA